MSPLLTLAVRNVARSKARSAITTGAITFGILMTLLLGALIHGMHRYLIEDTVKGRMGALQIHRRGYLEERDRHPLALDLEAGDAFEQTVMRVPGVASISPRIIFSGLVSNGTTATLFTAQGVEPLRERQVLPLAFQEARGARLGPDTPRGALLSTELADALGVQPGATLSLQATTRSGRENVLDVDVVGALDSDLMGQGKRMIYVPLPYAQELLRMKGRATEYVVALHEGFPEEEVAARLRAELGADYEVHTWSELQPAVAEAIRIQLGILLAVGGLFLIIAVIGVINTLLMSVMERTREIGTMMAVGVRREKIAALFVLEAAVLALLGCGLGVAVAWALAAGVTSSGGLPLTLREGRTFIFHPEVAGYQVAIAVTAATLGAVLAAAWPAWRAARLRPVEALRGA